MFICPFFKQTFGVFLLLRDLSSLSFPFPALELSLSQESGSFSWKYHFSSSNLGAGLQMLVGYCSSQSLLVSRSKEIHMHTFPFHYLYWKSWTISLFSILYKNTEVISAFFFPLHISIFKKKMETYFLWSLVHFLFCSVSLSPNDARLWLHHRTLHVFQDSTFQEIR